MYYNIKNFRIWPIAMTILLLAGFIMTGPGQPQNVCAEAVFQPVSQDIFNIEEIDGAMASERFMPPALYREADSAEEKPLWYPNELLPTAFDWSDYGAVSDASPGDPAFTDPNVTPAKSQGSCGSCYSFGTAGAVEAFLARVGLSGNDTDISENNIMNCNVRSANGNGGCNGGTFGAAINWLNKKGTVHEADEAYRDSNGACNANANFRQTILGWLRVGQNKEFPAPATIKNYLVNYGPLEVSVKADNPGTTGQKFKEYNGGDPIYMPLSKSDGSDHSVTLIGWNDDTTHQGGKGVWIIKNSWGTDWGKNGTAEVAYGSANLLHGWSNVPHQSQPYDSSGELLFYDVYGTGKSFYTSGMGNHGMVRFTPTKDSCIDRVEVQLFDKTDDIDIAIYGNVNSGKDSWGDTVLNPTNKLAEILDKSSVAGGNMSLQLPSPVRLTKDSDVYVAVSMQPGNLSADASTRGTKRSYSSRDGKNWSESSYTYNIRLRTKVCGANVSVAPTATNTPFVPTATATVPATPTPVPTTAPGQPTLVPTATTGAQTVCQAPPRQVYAMAASVEEQAAALPLKAKPLAPERFSPGIAGRFETTRSLLGRRVVQSSDPARRLGVNQLAPSVESNKPNQEQQYFTGLEETKAEPNTVGTLAYSDGSAAAFLPVYIFEVDNEDHAYSDPLFIGTTDDTGKFSLHLANGRYLLNAEPPLEDADGYPVSGIQSLKHIFEVGGTEEEAGEAKLGTLTLPATTKVIRGQVIHADGTPIWATSIDAVNTDTGQFVYTYPLDDGTFELNVSGGSWELSLLPDPGVTWISVDAEKNIKFAMNDTEEAADVNFKVREADALVTGQVLDPSGAPLTNDTLNDFGFNFSVSLDVFDTVSDRFAYGYLDASGTFTIPLPSGSYKGQVWIDSETYPQFTGPFLDEVISVEKGVVNIGEIRILAKNSVVSGVVRDSNGKPLSDIFVDIWQDNGSWLYGATDQNGAYEIVAPAGKWWIEPYPMPYHAHIYSGGPQEATLGAAAPAKADFALEPSSGRLFGTLVDNQNKLLGNVDAYVYIRRDGESTPISAVPVENGRFSMKMPYGNLRVGLFLGPNSPYVLPNEGIPEVSAASVSAINSLNALSALSLANREQAVFVQNAAVDRSVTLQVLPTNAKVQGLLQDTDGVAVTGITGYVVAVEQGRPQNWKWSEINPADGSYSLDLIASTWDLTYELDVEEESTLAPHPQAPTTAIAKANSTVTQNLDIVKLDGTISGTVVDESGNPVANSLVWIRSLGYESEIRTNENGEFMLRAPTTEDADGEVFGSQRPRPPRRGRATVGARAPRRGRGGLPSRLPRQAPSELGSDLPSEAQGIEFNDSGMARSGNGTNSANQNIQLVIRSSNAYVTGQVIDFFSEKPVQGAQISAVNRRDAQTFSTTTDANGCFSASVKADGDYWWSITAKYQDEDGWQMTSRLTLTGSATPPRNQVQASSAQAITNIPASAAMVLQYQGAMPQPEGHTFSVKSGWSHTMPDGFTIEIPPNAIDTREANINIRLTPKHTLDDTYLHNVVGYGYDISLSDSNGRAISGEFRTDVQLTLRYVESSVDSEDELMAGHFSGDQWHNEKQIVQDTNSNHFSVSIQKPGVYAVLAPNQISTPEPTGTSVANPTVGPTVTPAPDVKLTPVPEDTLPTALEEDEEPWFSRLFLPLIKR